MDVVVFAVTNLGLSFDELYKTTWAEFELRSFGFWKNWKENKIAEAKINWRLYSQWNSKPKPFEVFLKKEYGITIPKGKIQAAKIEAMKKAWAQYEKEIKGNG